MADDDLSKLPKDYYVRKMQFTNNVHQVAYPAIDPCRPDNSLAGKVVIITGASRGIGARAMVPSFVKAGVKGIALLASNAEKLAATEKKVADANPSIQTLVCAVDNTDDKGIDAACEKIKATFGHADVLVHAAGACAGDGVKLHETEPDEWWKNYEVNGKGSYLLTRAFLRQLPSPKTRGTIIYMSSWQAFITVPPMGAYFMSKFVVDNLATYVAAEYPNVTAVSVHPGMVATDMLREPFRSLFNNDAPELVGGTAVWLCQERAGFLSGRFVAANWDVEDLLARKDEIVKGDLLKLTLRGQFGIERSVGIDG